MNTMKIVLIITTLVWSSYFVYSARILSITPAIDINYKTFYLSLWRKLADKGHKITLLTTVLMTPHENITQIHLNKGYLYKKGVNKLNTSPNSKEKTKWLETDIFGGFTDYRIEALKTQKFDLVFLELTIPVLHPLVSYYQCPYIGINNQDATPLNHYYMGNIEHPYIHHIFELNKDISIFLRLRITLETILSFIIVKLNQFQDAFMRDISNKNSTDSFTIYDNMSSMFINTNPIFHRPKPLGPSTIDLGGFLNINETTDLPKDLQEYLDESKDGCIYVSFGTTVNSEYLSEDQKNIFVTVFKEMTPMRILWKFDDLDVAKDAQNIEVRKWVPQQDVLRHPNVKLFITQGGLQSMEEAIDSGVPMLGMPFYGDQVNNVNKMHAKKFGLKLLPSEMTERSLRASLFELLQNPIFEQTMSKMSAIAKDQPMKGLEKAVWWTEYVLRHGGTEHLRSPSADIPFYQYYFLDVIGVIIFIIFLFYVTVKQVCRAIYILYRLYKPKDKEE